MKRFLLSLVVALLAFTGAGAQEWVSLLSNINGLPGVLNTTASGEYYKFTSPLFDLGVLATRRVRITVLDTQTHERPNGNNYCFALSELAIYDGDGNPLSYSPISNADHNSLSSFFSKDGEGLDGLYDDNYNTYFHSMWSSINAVADYHYVELQLDKAISSFRLEWGTRMGQSKNAPTKVAVTLGTDYTGVGTVAEFELGEAVVSADELSVENRLFVMQSNSLQYHYANDGMIYWGSGPIFMLCAEQGTEEPGFENLMQLIDTGDGGYYVYWPVQGLFLKDSGEEYNGKNGWQESTSNIDEAAVVKFTPLASGDFEMSYVTTYNDADAGEVTAPLYVGAELRDNAMSKMKTFALVKKEALDRGDYTAGYSLPVAFNWSIYGAIIDIETVKNLSISVSDIATMKLSSLVQSANAYREQFGDFDGACTGSEIKDLETAIAAAEAMMGGASVTISQIENTVAEISSALVKYVAFKLDIYEQLVDSILENSTFSSYPYVTDTYPENSRSILVAVRTSITDAKQKTGIYSADQYAALYRQIEADIALFHSTKITYQNFPIEYGDAAGLPGVKESYGGYVWTSPIVTLRKGVEGIRLTFDRSTDDGQLFDGYPMISLAEVKLFDANGSKISLNAAAFSTNSQELSEGDISGICDGSTGTYWHSIWKNGEMNPVGKVYLDIAFPAPMSSFYIELSSRDNGKLFPTEITLTAKGEVGEEEGAADEECIYVYLTDGGVDAFPVSEIDGGYYTEGDFLCVPLTSGDVLYYTSQEYDSISAVVPQLPEFKSYKFNNKYNPTLNVDAEAGEISDEMVFSLNAIGKWLTASFQLSDDRAVAYVDTVLQESKVTRQSFATPKVYTVTYPGYKKILGKVKVQDEVWEYTDEVVEEIPLEASMLSTNKPSTSLSEGVGSLLDNDVYTYFHSTWGSANDATINVNAYIDIALPQPTDMIKLYYLCRQQSGYAPKTLEIYAGDNAESLTLVRTLTSAADGLPTGSGWGEYTSPAISLNGNYSYLRVLQSAGEYAKNHMALSELRIYDVTPGDSVLVSEAEYAQKRVPFGRQYKVAIDWLTDNAISVPRIDIDIVNGAEVVSKEKYLSAKFRITGYGVYDNFEDSVQIKGRGNTSWGYSKKPYRLKFSSKVKPFGLTKGKSWVLLANAQTYSMMANAVAMKIGQMAGAEYTNHIIPVELYINGTYRGSYMFTEKVGLANNSVDVDEELGCLLELDTYYDENYKFKSMFYNMPVNIKEPDLTEYTSAAAAERKALIQKEYNAIDSVVFNSRGVDKILDMEALSRFMLVNELVCNQEIGHPKSTYLFKEELGNPESKMKFGPVWDFDWAFGYESTRDYCVANISQDVLKSSMATEPGHTFFTELYNITVVNKYYHKVWKEFLDKKSLDELKDYMDSYYNFASRSFENNSTVWGDGYGYDEINTRMQAWINDRAWYIYGNLRKFNLDEFAYPYVGDVNKNNLLTIHDIALTTAYNNGNTHASFTFAKADVDGDKSITTDDILAIASEVKAAQPLTAMQMYKTPMALGELYANDFEMVMGEASTLPLLVSRYDGEEYKALQMDIEIPDGVSLTAAEAAGSLSDHKVTLSRSGMTSYRLLVYSEGDNLFSSDEEAVVNLTFVSDYVVPEESRVISLSNALIIDNETNELRLNNYVAQFGISTNIHDATQPTASVTGGDYLTITSLTSQNVNIYSVDGRLVRTLRVKEGTTRVELQAGVYVVLGAKVAVK